MGEDDDGATEDDEVVSLSTRSSTSSSSSSVAPKRTEKTRGCGGSRPQQQDLAPLTDEQCVLTTPWVIGMDMKTKKWGKSNHSPLSDCASID